ncbi:hypothetical protein MMC16_003688 [Acarospora aff. strigata]|nr:hypothetical protein [Acarospora aff. strigata]
MSRRRAGCGLHQVIPATVNISDAGTKDFRLVSAGDIYTHSTFAEADGCASRPEEEEEGLVLSLAVRLHNKREAAETEAEEEDEDDSEDDSEVE